MLRSLTFKRSISSKVIGIDLGTTNSAVAYIRDTLKSNNGLSASSAVIIENDQGHRTTPSIVSIALDPTTGKEKTYVGLQAKRQQIINLENTFFATKRLIGRKFNEKEVQRDIKIMPYKIVQDEKSGNAMVMTTDNKRRTPSEISSIILRYLKNTATEYLNEDVKYAVVTVPAYFNDAQRQATKDAGRMAGLKVLRVVNEPTAAALSFGLKNSEQYKENGGLIAVYDLGGGTFDISILDIENGIFEVKSTNGDTHLGGEDFDNVIINHLLDCFINENQTVDKNALVKDRNVMQRLREASEKIKIELSHVSESTVEIPFFYDGYHLNVTLKEKELDELTMHLIERTIEPVKKAIRDADIETCDIDEVIMVGGMTRMPKIRSVIEHFFGKKPNVTVNPDETVALGAAIQGGILSGEIKNVLLLDVTPLTLGIETFGGAFSPLLPRNTTIPVKKTEIFSTGVDGQTGVDIKVYQGERGLVRDNKLIGDFSLKGITPMPKGQPQILVTFDVDADGIINVSASERSSGKEQSITVIANSGLTEEEVNKLVEEGNANREQDNILRQRMDLITKADIMISDTERSFKSLEKSMSEDEEYKELKQEIEAIRAMINTFKKEINDTKLDVNVIKKTTDALQNNVFKFFKKAMATSSSNKQP
ncbi:hypothetical protein KAFR_0A06150 [Kazachstania africana CBS 2517]|uniref:Iron-sulfur cluster biogenesis chaperone, mitochondrial n=1 Tax=Kazachstania africana (strain ATCC 22294 / BCRC 22015 / CBS 2517 / CECT 1963 / NBRC 1671 / NRRL Y-8276) TaxID=1071382 RepID=H2ANV0_KAZAF|nr:hypothetical protein KAFR_0A06150 [Kazachstania africana CBS 2517]CCF56050.1 hypothetical protein KAFR_0A06150 [Kazachstania africana CBS 2517]